MFQDDQPVAYYSHAPMTAIPPVVQQYAPQSVHAVPQLQPVGSIQAGQQFFVQPASAATLPVQYSQAPNVLMAAAHPPNIAADNASNQAAARPQQGQGKQTLVIYTVYI